MQVALTTARLAVRSVTAADAAELLAFVERNRARLKPWDPDPPRDYFTLGYWERFGALEASSTSIRLIAHEPDRATIVAKVNLQSIERGVIQRSVLGYSVDGAYEGRGFAREAVGAAVDFAFASLGLHRVEANYQPANERSGRLLRGLGFVVEGYARDYLFLDGAWRDHVLTSLTNPAYGAPGPPLH